MFPNRLQLLRLMLLLGAASALLPADAQPSAPAAGPNGQQGPLLEVEESLFDAFLTTPGRPDWAPLEILWGHREWREPLLLRLRDQDPTERARAALALGLTGATRARRALADARHDHEAVVRRYAGLALCYMGDSRGEAEATRVLREGEVWERYLALIGLWRLDSPSTRTMLESRRLDQGPLVKSLIPLALASRPWKPTHPYPSRTGDTPEAAPGEELWEQVADDLALSSDYWWHEGDYDQVCVLLEQSLFFSPHRVETYDDVAWLQWSLGHGQRAVQVLEKGIAVSPESWLAHFNLGFHYFNTKRYAPALPYLKYAVEHTETWWVPLHTYAHDLEALGKRDEALRVWQETVQRFPQDETARRNLARLTGTR